MSTLMQCWNCNRKVAKDDEFCTCREKGSLNPLRFGKYRVQRSLGSGAFGTVFCCFDPDLKRHVAVKKLDRFAFNIAGELLELEAPARLNHPNIVATYDVMLDVGAIVMEYVDGGTLEAKLRNDAPWVKQNFTRIMLEICDALRAAHAESIVHRDIKPENILLTSDGHAKIADFGVCALLSTAEYTDSIAGSPPYMAKEVLAGEPYSFEADIHSLGCVMFEIWAGKRPFVANGGLTAFLAVKSSVTPPPLLEVSPGIDDILSDLVGRMLTSGPRRVRNIETVSQQLTFRDPSPSTGAPTIDQLQQNLGAIYGYANSDKSPLYLLVQYLISIRTLTQELLREDRDVTKLEVLYPKSFAWLCAAASSVNVRLGQLIWLKYDGRCPYCREQVCKCATGWQGGDEDRNALLLEQMEERLVSHSPEPHTFQQYQAMFARMFGESNETEGMDRVILHSFSEVAEALDAVLHLLPQNDPPSVLALHLEFSDLIAWFFALLNSYHPDFDFVDALNRTFDCGCYACGKNQCVCPEPLGVTNWRQALKVVPAYEA